MGCHCLLRPPSIVISTFQVAFKIFSVYLDLSSLTTMFLTVVLFLFVLLDFAKSLVCYIYVCHQFWTIFRHDVFTYFLWPIPSLFFFHSRPTITCILDYKHSLLGLFTVLHRYCIFYKLKFCGNPAPSKCIGTIFNSICSLDVSALPFGNSQNFQTFSLLLYMLW